MVIRPPLKKWIFGWSNDHVFYGNYFKKGIFLKLYHIVKALKEENYSLIIINKVISFLKILMKQF